MQLDGDTHGVDLQIPPVFLLTRRKRPLSGPEDNFGKHLRFAERGYHQGSQSSSRSTAICTSSAATELRPICKPEGIHEYLDFVDITEPRVLVVLQEEHIKDHHAFASGTITKDDLRALGFSLGIISALLDNVTQFDDHLCEEAKIVSHRAISSG